MSTMHLLFVQFLSRVNMRDIVLADLSVLPSHSSIHTLVLHMYLNECTYRQTLSTVW